SSDYQKLTPAQRKIIDNYLRDLRLAGVHLEAQAKTRFAEIQKQLSELTTTFSENILDATHAWTLHVTDRDALKGLPLETIKMTEDILKKRHELAQLLGFKNYAEYSLKTKMAKTPERVLTFLNNLVDKSKKTAKLEMDELTAFAKTIDVIETLEAWDIAYYSE